MTGAFAGRTSQSLHAIGRAARSASLPVHGSPRRKKRSARPGQGLLRKPVSNHTHHPQNVTSQARPAGAARSWPKYNNSVAAHVRASPVRRASADPRRAVCASGLSSDSGAAKQAPARARWKHGRGSSAFGHWGPCGCVPVFSDNCPIGLPLVGIAIEKGANACRDGACVLGRLARRGNSTLVGNGGTRGANTDPWLLAQSRDTAAG